MNLFDPLQNAHAAYRVSNNGRNMSPWTVTHGSGGARYLQFRGAALAGAMSHGAPSTAGCGPVHRVTGRSCAAGRGRAHAWRGLLDGRRRRRGLRLRRCVHLTVRAGRGVGRDAPRRHRHLDPRRVRASPRTRQRPTLRQRPAGSTRAGRGADHDRGAPEWRRLLDLHESGSRACVRRRAHLRRHGRHPVERTRHRLGTDTQRQRLLDGRLGRWHLQLRRRALLRFDRWVPAEPTRRRDRGRPGRRSATG